MPTFNFSLPKKETKARKTSHNTNKYEVVAKNIKGVIWIDEFANYTVKVSDEYRYEIYPACYSCKGVNRIYGQFLDDNRRICIIRNVDEYTECNPYCYLPFAPGCVVTGDIVVNNYTKQFKIKSCNVELDNDDAHAALVFYRQNYNTISSALEKRRLNESGQYR